MMFRRKPTTCIGVDWGSRAIKLAYLERRGSSVRIARKAIVRTQLSLDSLEGEVPRGPSCEADEFPQGLLRDGGFPRRAAASLLPMAWTDVRTFELPTVDPLARTPLIAGELADVFGEEIGDRVFDWWEAESGPQDAIKIHVASARTEQAMKLSEALSNAHVHCEVMDVLPFTVGRALKLAGANAGFHLALDWGFSSATITVVRGVVPIYTRILRECGLNQVIRQIVGEFGVSLVDAESLLMHPGLPGSTPLRGESAEAQSLIADLIDESLRHLVEQLDKTLTYVESEWQGSLNNPLWLLGGGATINNVDAYLAQKLGVHVVPWGLPNARNEKASADDVLFASAAALSVVGWSS